MNRWKVIHRRNPRRYSEWRDVRKDTPSIPERRVAEPNQTNSFARKRAQSFISQVFIFSVFASPTRIVQTHDNA